MQPLLLGSSVRDDNLTLTADLTNPDIFDNGQITLPRDTIHIVRTAYLWSGAAHQRIAVGNHGETTVDVTLSLSFGSDFADLFEVRGQHRERRGRLRELAPDGKSVSLIYRGLDGATRRTELIFDPIPSHLVPTSASYELRLEPHASTYLYFCADCHGSRAPAPMSFFKGLMAANRDHRWASRHSGSIEPSNQVLNDSLCPAMADPPMLLA